jgi:hypothetical protein
LTLYLSLYVLLTPSLSFLGTMMSQNALAISKELPQEESVVTKSLTVPSAKGTPTRASKCLKKAAAAGTSLEAHQPTVLSKNVSIAFLS